MRIRAAKAEEDRDSYIQRIVNDLTEEKEFDNIDARHNVASKMWSVQEEKDQLVAEALEKTSEGEEPEPTGPIHRTNGIIERAAHGDDDDDDVVDERKATFIASTDTVDRQGDTIAMDGWKLKAFKQNPVLLFAHNSRDLPIGKVDNIKVEDGKLVAETTGVEEGIHELADKVWKMLATGFLNAVSVGFRALEYEPRFAKDGEWLGMAFLSQELLELSVVPVPANPEAIMIARSYGADSEQIFQLFTDAERQMDALVQAQFRSKELELMRLRPA